MDPSKSQGSRAPGPDGNLLPGRVAAFLKHLRALDAWTLDRQMELTAIPAPPFGEAPRGRRMGELFSAWGLENVEGDEEGNILGWYEGDSEGSPAPLILSAHLDTVFPPGTSVRPRKVKGRILAPGIADDGRGLAALLALIRILAEREISLPFPLLFVATVGEEGAGNLRGVRHLFRSGGPGAQALGFISLDGVGMDRVVHVGVGSTRLRITARSSGGHSWTDWGMVNPIHTLGVLVAMVDDLPLPSSPRTTVTVARWGGGKSINSIPQEAWVEMDLRSHGKEELTEVEEAVLKRCRRVEAGGRGKKGALRLAVETLGRRPAGSTPPEAPLVRAALEATRALNVEPILDASSTDANLPMSLGIPAITLGAGGRAGGIHTLEEWFENQKGPEGILRALLTILRRAELEGVGG